MYSYAKTPSQWRRLPATISYVILIAWGMALVPAALAGQNNAGDNLQVEIGKTVEITWSHRYCWFPTVHRFATGEIFVTMQMSPDEIGPENEFTAYCISRDGGMTWSRRYTMGAGASADGAYSAEPQKDGAIWQLHNYPIPFPEGQSQQFHTALTKFLRGAMEVQQMRDEALIRLAHPAYMARVSLFDRATTDGQVQTEVRGMPWGPIVDGLNGDLMCPMYYTAANDNRKAQGSEWSYYRTVLLRSSDSGRTWNEFSTIAGLAADQQPWPWMGTEGPCEPGLVRLADQRLCVVFRTSGDGIMGETWSSDDGRTWTPPVSTGLKGVAVRMRRLSNGMVALTTGRPGPVVIMFSTDGTGKQWTHITPIFTDKSTRYTDFIELEPGKLFVVYDAVPYGWHEIPYTDREAKDKIYGTFVTVVKKQQAN